MKFTSGPLFATLALTAYLPGILAAEGFHPSQRTVAVLRRGELANNGTAAVANGTEAADAAQAEENNQDAEQNADENADENVNEDQNADQEANGDEQQLADQQLAEEQNQNQDANLNQDENLQEDLDNLQNADGIDIDQNNLQGSLQQNIGNMMLSLGVCNFNLGSISGIGINNQIQLLLQLQQLQQLQQLGLVNSVSVQQLIQQELLLNNFNLNIIKRTVNASVKQAAREQKRTIMTKRECNKGKGN
ncbi:hypothetical protein F4804DRAFT_207680 [Jackrogersella minutella]|nr:hypothetical protein F4804DRAFT_207680 [Jackrogersella minutella]